MKIDILVKDFELKLIDRHWQERNDIEIKIECTPMHLEVLNKLGFKELAIYYGPIMFVSK